MKRLITSLLKKDPYTRISIPEILNHPWLNEYKPKDDIRIPLLGALQCVNPQINQQSPSSHPCSHVNIVNLGNLFFQNCINQKIFQSDYYYIATDFYSTKISIYLNF